jgi:hypothetical protein
MQLTRPNFAPDPRRFGRGRVFDGAMAVARTPLMSADLKLFATTFAAGFIFVSVLIA